jgi:hypothetical protein
MFGHIYHASDPLCSKVYAWEEGCSLAGSSICTMSLARVLVRRACRYYKVRIPTVLPAGAKCRTSFYLPQHQRIYIIPDHRNPVVVLHEAAHHITDVLFGHESTPDHSKEWFSIFMWLLLKLEIFKQPFLAGSLRPYGLRLRPLGPERIPK